MGRAGGRGAGPEGLVERKGVDQLMRIWLMSADFLLGCVVENWGVSGNFGRPWNKAPVKEV